MAAGVDVPRRRRATADVRVDVVVFGPEAIAAVGALHAVEVGRGAEFERDHHLDRYVARPPGEVTQVLAVEEDPVQKGIGGNFPSDLRSDGSYACLLYTSPSPRDRQKSRMPSSA